MRIFNIQRNTAQHKNTQHSVINCEDGTTFFTFILIIEGATEKVLQFIC
jgi:hypothetical protein